MAAQDAGAVRPAHRGSDELDDAIARRVAIEDLEETRRLERQVEQEPAPSEVQNNFLKLVGGERE